MHHEHHPQNASHPSIAAHLVLLLAAVLVVAGVYLYFQNTSSAGALLVVLGLALAGLYLLRGFLLNALRAMHTPPAAGHTHANLQTEGLTISWALPYDLLVKALFFGGEERTRKTIVRLANIRPGTKVLDVGCGTGSLAITARLNSAPDAQIFGTDAAPEMIELARRKAARASAQVDFQTGLVEDIHFPDNTLDVVMNSFMVHHLPGDLKKRAFAEMLRVLKPGGKLLVVDFEPPKGQLARALLSLVLGQGMLFIDNRTIPPLLETAGFVSIETGNAGHRLATYISAQKPG